MAGPKYQSDEWYERESVEATLTSGATVTAIAELGSGATVNVASAIETGANYIGLASVNVSPIPAGAAWIGLASVAFPGTDATNSVVKTEQQFSHWYTSGPTANAIVKGSAGFLHSIIVGEAVASSTIEVSDHATDGDGAVKIFLDDDAMGPAVYPVNAKFTTGITLDIVNQTKVTVVYR